MYWQTQLPSSMESQLFEITKDIKKKALESGIQNGLCVVTALTEGAAVFTLSGTPTGGTQDFLEDWCRMVPLRENLLQPPASSDQVASSIRAALLGTNCELLLCDGEIIIGAEQDVFITTFGTHVPIEYALCITGE